LLHLDQVDVVAVERRGRGRPEARPGRDEIVAVEPVASTGAPGIVERLESDIVDPVEIDILGTREAPNLEETKTGNDSEEGAVERHGVESFLGGLRDAFEHRVFTTHNNKSHARQTSGIRVPRHRKCAAPEPRATRRRHAVTTALRPAVPPP
jgi:hypothetical protein